MSRMNAALFMLFGYVLLAVIGCATSKPLPDPVDIKTLGEMISRDDQVPVDQAMDFAVRMVPYTKFANQVEVCEVSVAKEGDMNMSREKSLALAVRDLSIAFTASDVARLKALPARSVWWVSTLDNVTVFTLFCIVPPATPAAQKAYSMLPGRRAPTPAPATVPIVVQDVPASSVAPAVASAPKSTGSIWDGAAKYAEGEAFAFNGKLCSVGRAELRKPRLKDEAMDTSSFLAAANILLSFKTRFKIVAYDGDANELLKEALYKEWRLPTTASMEAAVCVAMPEGGLPHKAVAAN